jgi:hypothetical protein
MKKVLMTTIALLMVTSLAMANGGGRGPGGPGGDFGFGPGGELLVSSDGTVFLTRTVSDSATGAATTTITAVRSTRTTAWTATLPVRDGHLTLSGTNLLSVTSSMATDGTVSSTITAISTASGATAWTLTRAGRVTELEAFNGGTYAIVVTPAATTGAAATRSLIAISPTGTVLWSVTV